MDQKLIADSISSIRKALEEFITPSFRELRTETHADTAELRGVVDRLDADIAQLRSESSQSRQETAANFVQVREEARQFRAETAENFAQVRGEARQFRAETAENFAQVREESRQLRAEMTINFVQVRDEIGGLRGEFHGLRGEFTDLRGEVKDLRGEVNSLRSAMERGFSEIGAKLDLQADVHRLKEQVASLQASQQARALEAH